MKKFNRIRIAYIAGRLITGKRIASLYDFNELLQIEIASLPDADCLTKSTSSASITGYQKA